MCKTAHQDRDNPISSYIDKHIKRITYFPPSCPRALPSEAVAQWRKSFTCPSPHTPTHTHFYLVSERGLRRETDPRQRGCGAEARRHGRRPRSRPSPVDSRAARCPHGRPDPRPTAPLPMARPNPRCACACGACAHGPAADKFDDVTVTISVATGNGSVAGSSFERGSRFQCARSSRSPRSSLHTHALLSFCLQSSRQRYRSSAIRSVAILSLLSCQLISAVLRSVRM